MVVQQWCGGLAALSAALGAGMGAGMGAELGAVLTAESWGTGAA